jgi:two-component system, NtrC family, response regulator AtoC
MPRGVRTFVVDDDPSLRYALEAVLVDAGAEVRAFSNAAECIQALESCLGPGHSEAPEVIVSDLAMPGLDGLGLLARVKQVDPSVPVIILTAHGSERIAVSAMKAGAFDYLPKPFDPDELALAVRRGADMRSLRLDNGKLRAEAQLRRNIIAESPALRRVLDLVARVGPKDVTVLVSGESGSGKDVIATALHAHSKRAAKPLIRFNAAAIPQELAEAELFGHSRGAFTGAREARNGYFQQAHGGTLFIDEIGDLPLTIQAKILRALQSGEVQRVGGQTETVDVRLVAATNRDLESDVKAGRFREDLYYRLNVVPIRVPSLRERPEDIEPLATSFAHKYADRYGMPPVLIAPDLLAELKTRPWQGNVRELENTIARLVALTQDETLSLALWSGIQEDGKSSVRLPAAALTSDVERIMSVLTDAEQPFRTRMEALERGLIEQEFLASGKNQSETARRLRMSRPALVEKLHKHGLIGR